MNNEELIKKVADEIIICTKEILTTDEVAKYLGMSKSYLYKLTMNRQIPHYKPLGKMCYYNRKEIEEWILINRIDTDAEIEREAQKYCLKKGSSK